MAENATDYITAARRALDQEIYKMSALVESQLKAANLAFERRDPEAAQAVISGDRRIDDYDRDIEARVMSLLGAGVREQGALREVMTVMKVAGELERVGDLAKNVAKRTMVISQEAPNSPISGVVRMSQVSRRLFSDILNAYFAKDLNAAIAVWRGDDEIDELYNSVFEEILIAMMEDPGRVNACTHLVFIAKNFERVGDHATNIAEAIHFLLTGSPIIEERPKGDKTSTISVTPPKHSRVIGE